MNWSVALDTKKRDFDSNNNEDEMSDPLVDCLHIQKDYHL